jgi:predicted membrane channel-forming protein YqfA (hemolysin III family)
MLFFTGLWLLLKDGEGFKKYMLFLSVAYTIGAVFYILFPNGQDLRPLP